MNTGLVCAEDKKARLAGVVTLYTPPVFGCNKYVTRFWGQNYLKTVRKKKISPHQETIISFDVG